MNSTFLAAAVTANGRSDHGSAPPGGLTRLGLARNVLPPCEGVYLAVTLCIAGTHSTGSRQGMGPRSEPSSGLCPASPNASPTNPHRETYARVTVAVGADAREVTSIQF